MSKRQADSYLTKEPSRNRPDEDYENERDKIDPVQVASAEVMATRKIAKPRRNRFAHANAAGSTDVNTGMNGGAMGSEVPASNGGGLFGGIKAPTFSSSTLPSFSFGSTTSTGSNPFAKISTTTSTPVTSFGSTTSREQKPSNPFASIKMTTSSATTAEQKPSNPFASIKPATAATSEPKSLFPPNSPFAKIPPAPIPSSFTREMASQPISQAASQPARSSGPIRTPRHSVREPAPNTFQAGSFQTPQQPAPQSQPSRTIETPSQRALVRSNGDNVPIATPDRNPSDPPEKHYWQRIKAMNEAFHEAVGRSIEGDGYCNLEWLFGQYKYWREEIEKGYPYNPSVDSPAPVAAITTKSSRLEDLKSGITMKPPTPSRSTIESLSYQDPFTRSQAPPPETQREITWDGGSTQSTERTRSFGQSQETPKAGSKTAETILGALESPDENRIGDVRGEYKSTMENLKKRTEKEKDMGMFGMSPPKTTTTKPAPIAPFTFGRDVKAGSQPSSFGGSSFGSTAAAKSFSFATIKSEAPAPSRSTFAFGASTRTEELTPGDSIRVPGSGNVPKPFSFGSASRPSKPSAFGQGSSFPTTTKASSFGKGSSFTTPTSSSKPLGQTSATSVSAPGPFSFSARKTQTKVPSPPNVSQPPPPPPVVIEPPAPNRFTALSTASPEKEVITIDSDDEMADEPAKQDEEMEDEEEEEEVEEAMSDEEEEEQEEENEAMGDEEIVDDDEKDKDYVVLDEEEGSEEQEPEPAAEEVAKEVEELVKSSPELKEKEASKPAPFTFGASITGTTATAPAFTFNTAAKPFGAPFTFGSSISKSTTSGTEDQKPQGHTQPFSFGAKPVDAKPAEVKPAMDDQVPKITSSEKSEETESKEQEMSEIQPPLKPSTAVPVSQPSAKPQEPKTHANPVFKFGLPSTPSTFKGDIPQLDRTPASALRREFKFGLPGKPAEKEDEPAKEPEAEKEAGPKSPRRSLRSSSPSKRSVEETAPKSPSKRQRPASPQKREAEKETATETKEETVPVSDTIEVLPPPKPFVFGAKTSMTNPSTADIKDTPATFTFGSTAKIEATATSQDASKSFSFGSSVKKDFTWTPDKPIKFDTPPSKPASSAFTFGASTAQPFQFGGLSTPVPPAPKFGTTSAFSAFGGQTVSLTPPSLGFSFGSISAAPEKKEEPQVQAQPEEAQAEGEGEATDEPPVVSDEVGTAGEEDEETVFSERAKLIQRLSAAERAAEQAKNGGKEVKLDRDYGVGVVRVNIHKTTKKGRILFRLEGSGRVILNSYLVPGVEYVKQGKSMVLVPAPKSDGMGFESYYVRVKDAGIAENLAKTLQEKKNVA